VKILHNVPRLLWWVGALGLYIYCHYALFMIALMLLCAAPLKEFILGSVYTIDDLGDMAAATSVTKVGTLDTMTRMTVMKSIMYADKGPQEDTQIRMLDISPRKKAK